jgi:hypothetical protein
MSQSTHWLKVTESIRPEGDGRAAGTATLGYSGNLRVRRTDSGRNSTRSTTAVALVAQISRGLQFPQG